MGYYTKHVLKAQTTNDFNSAHALSSVIEEVSSKKLVVRDDKTVDDHCCNDGDGTNWPNFDRDMLEISQKMGNEIIFAWLYEEDDTERERLYQNGKMISEYTYGLGSEHYGHNLINNDFDAYIEKVHEKDFGPLKDKLLRDEIVKLYGVYW